MKDLTRYLTVLFAVIPLSALLCSLVEMPGMFDLTKENFLTIQGFNLELSWLIIFEIAALLMTVVLIIIEKKKKRTFRHLIVAGICYLVSIALFFIFILPDNISTEGWTILPTDWDLLRNQWEYSTAIRAIFSFAGFSFIVLAFLKNRNYYRVYE